MNGAGIDLVVGAKGSPLQIILSGIYHVDYPTGNINYREALELTKNPLVKQTVPLALGDNYKGYRIVGSTHAYPVLHKAQVREGDFWKDDFEVTIGAKVASQTGLTTGSHFTGVHGFVQDAGHAHDAHPYIVKGIFTETGTVLDQLILTSVESVWKMHDHHDHGDPHHDHDHDHHDHEHHDHDHGHTDHEHGDPDDKEITALLVQYQNPMGAMTLPRLINSSTRMQAASPVLEVNRLYSLMGVGMEALTYISGLIMLISALSIFISLLNSLKDRKYELALIRVMGGGRLRLFSILLFEGITLAIVGYMAGFLVSRIILSLLSAYTESNFHYTLREWISPEDGYLFIISLIIGGLAALLPAVKAMRTDISKTLSQ